MELGKKTSIRQRLIALFSVLTLGALALPSHAGLTYDMTFVWTGGGSGEQIYQVTQVGETAVAIRGDSPQMYSDPNSGSYLIQEPMMGTSIPLWISSSPAESIDEGSRHASSSGGTEAIESLAFSLKKGGQPDREVDGITLSHHVLTVDMDWLWVNPKEQKYLTKARVDLWTAADLPFTWLPYGDMTREGALPGMFNHPKIANWIRAELAEELRALGLVVEADVAVDFINVEYDFAQEYRREVRLSNIQTNDMDSLALPDSSYVSMDQYRAFFGAFLGGSRMCMTEDIESPIKEFSLTDDVAQVAAAKGAPATAMVQGQRTNIVLGGLVESADNATCALVILGEGALRAGEFTVLAESNRGQLAGGQAVAVIMSGSREGAMNVVMAESGTLTLSGDESNVSGEVSGEGLKVVMTQEPETATVYRDVDLSITFAAQAAGE